LFPRYGVLALHEKRIGGEWQKHKQNEIMFQKNKQEVSYVTSGG